MAKPMLDLVQPIRLKCDACGQELSAYTKTEYRNATGPERIETVHVLPCAHCCQAQAEEHEATGRRRLLAS